MENKKYLVVFTIIGLLIGIISAVAIPTFAATKTGTVTTRTGEKNSLKINAEITKVNNRQITFKDIDTNKEYTAGIGPVWYSESPKVGDKLQIEGIEVDGERAKEKGNTFLITKLGDKVLREDFPGKPAWAGKGGNGQGQGEGKGQGKGQGMNQSEGPNFIDADKNGICDNAEKK
ncbi:MAG: hypothetical protein PHI88_01575 [Candidatus Pacebacteria bacterium]|nr:hypothetical protein [Candidatus Paceibacterota bacterium]